MRSTDLSKDQARKMYAATAPTLGYLSRLVRRMDATRFPGDDRLYRAALKAHAAMGETRGVPTLPDVQWRWAVTAQLDQCRASWLSA